MDAFAPTSARPRMLVWLALIALAAYGALLWRLAGVQPGGSDSSGYFNAARIFAAGEVSVPMRPLEGLPGPTMPWLAYVPLGYRPDATHTALTPTYPTGLPLLLWASIRAFGPTHGPNLLFTLHALAGIWLTYRLARAMGGGRPLALIAAVMLALSPLYLMHALYAMSDLPSLVWLTAAVYFSWRSQSRGGLSLAAGLAMGVAVLLRPTNLLAILPVAFALGGSPRRWLGLVAGGLPCAGFLLWYNRAAYGSALSSGYGDFSDLMGVQWVFPTLGHYVRYLPAIATPLVLLALGLPWIFRRNPRAALVLSSWILVCLGFYACYYHTHETWWYLRFILPALPALIIAALLVAEALLPAPTPTRGWALLGVVALASNLYWSDHWGVRFMGRNEDIYRDATRWVQGQVPPGAVIFSMQMSGALHYYTDYQLVRWDTLEGAWPRVQASLVRSGRPAYGVFFDFETQPAIIGKLPGHWSKLGQLRQVSLWRLEP